MPGMAQNIKRSIKAFFLNRGIQLDRFHPRRMAISLARVFGYSLVPLHPDFPVDPPIIGQDLEVLRDPQFRQSIDLVRQYTLLDVARLANLWSLARLTGPGTFLEIGTFRGGGALHIANSVPERRMFVFDTFEGFRRLTPGLDDIFGADWFRDTTEEHVRRLFESAGRSATIVRGFFPDSARDLDLDLDRVAFCHLDVDVYEATRDSLEFLAPRLAPRSLIVLDDFQRGAHGLDQALGEFLQRHKTFMSLPLFPGQAVLFSRTLWDT